MSLDKEGGMSKILISFLLTSVVGAFIGSWVQNRIWLSQYNVELIEKERAAATEEFLKVSNRMDKELHVMRMFLYVMDQHQRDPHNSDIEKYANELDKVSDEYFGEANQHLAVVEWHFGKKTRASLST